MLELNLDQCRRILNAEPFDVQQFYDNFSAILSCLESETGKEKALRFNSGGSIQEWEIFGVIALRLDLSDSRMGLQVYRSWYETLLRYQGEAPKGRIHKGLPLHQLGLSYFGENRNLGKKYIQLAVIEDILSDPAGWKNKPGYRFLKNFFMVPDIELDLLENQVDLHRDDSYSMHPESILLAFKLQKDGSIIRDFERNIFQIDRLYANQLLQNLNNGKDSWKDLEYLMAYLLSSIDGFDLAGKNVGTSDYEIDLLIRNTITNDPTFASFGKYILVECKNWQKSVGSEQVNHFLSKIRFHYASCGILIAKEGISGKRCTKRVKNAELTILKAFHQDNIVLMVLTIDDLERVVKGENLASILIKEYERIRFDRTVR